VDAMPGTALYVFIHILFYLDLTSVHEEPHSERVSDQPKVEQLLGGKVRIWSQSWLQSPCHFKQVTKRTAPLWVPWFGKTLIY
jgi:hypothetical protein